MWILITWTHHSTSSLEDTYMVYTGLLLEQCYREVWAVCIKIFELLLSPLSSDINSSARYMHYFLHNTVALMCVRDADSLSYECDKLLRVVQLDIHWNRRLGYIHLQEESMWYEKSNQVKTWQQTTSWVTDYWIDHTNLQYYNDPHCSFLSLKIVHYRTICTVSIRCYCSPM